MPKQGFLSHKKFAVYFRNIFNVSSNVHIFADSGEDAAAYVEKNGYGYADGTTLYPRKIERVELVQS